MMKDPVEGVVFSSSSTLLLLFGSVIVGAIFVFLFIAKSQSDDSSDEESTASKVGKRQLKEKKKPKPSRNNRSKEDRGRDQQGKSSSVRSSFDHPWLLTTLTSQHRGTILDFDLSRNKKYLATCGDGPSCKPPPPHVKEGLKHRKTNSTDLDVKHINNMLCIQPGYHLVMPQYCMPYVGRPRKHHGRYRTVPEVNLYPLVRKYALAVDQMVALGYPVDIDGRRKGAGKAAKSADRCIQTCCRCQKEFRVRTTSGEHEAEERCVYHWGKLLASLDKPKVKSYRCCSGRPDSEGCETAKCHVTLGSQDDGDFDGYVKSRPCVYHPIDGNFGICAIDCEMCFTAEGLELTRVTLLRVDGSVLYDRLVKPRCPIVDYNTRFSGLTEKDLRDVRCTLADVQRDLLNLLNADTVLVGHGLENDLRALRLMHPTVVDTVALFPHRYGLPFRRSLRSLAHIYLQKEIQASDDGHDSVEDAKSTLELLFWTIKKDTRHGA